MIGSEDELRCRDTIELVTASPVDRVQAEHLDDFVRMAKELDNLHEDTYPSLPIASVGVSRLATASSALLALHKPLHQSARR